MTLLQNIDIGTVPATPGTNIFDASEVTPIAHDALLRHGRSLGFPISYAQEQRGLLVQNLLPIKKTETEQISSSSKVVLELHTETAFHPFKPSFILLLCLRGDESAATTYSLSEDFLAELDDGTIELLQLPLYSTSVDQSFNLDGKSSKDLVMPVLRKTQSGDYEVTYDKHAMKALTDDAARALENLTQAILRSTRRVVLRPGEMLVIDNSKTVHGRTVFTPRYDGTDRWLLRLLVVKHLPPPTHVDGHTITTIFE